MNDFDFHCWVIKYDNVCIKGYLYQKDSLEECHGQTVPLLWNHYHDDPGFVLGTATLEHREEGVYGYFKLFDTPFKGAIDTMIEHYGSVSTSPFVTLATVRGNRVVHGRIVEVSLTPERVDQHIWYYPIIEKESTNDISL